MGVVCRCVHVCMCMDVRVSTMNICINHCQLSIMEEYTCGYHDTLISSGHAQSLSCDASLSQPLCPGALVLWCHVPVLSLAPME